MLLSTSFYTPTENYLSTLHLVQAALYALPRILITMIAKCGMRLVLISNINTRMQILTPMTTSSPLQQADQKSLSPQIWRAKTTPSPFTPLARSSSRSRSLLANLSRPSSRTLVLARSLLASLARLQGKVSLLSISQGGSPTPSSLHTPPFSPLFPPFFRFVCPSAGMAGEGDRTLHSFLSLSVPWHFSNESTAQRLVGVGTDNRTLKHTAQR